MRAVVTKHAIQADSIFWLQNGRHFFDEIHAQAGLFKGGSRVTRKVAEGVFEPAYLWPMFE